MDYTQTKKVFSFIACMALLLFMTACEEKPAGISLTQLLGVNASETKNVILQADLEHRVTVDTNAFFALADDIVLVPTANPSTMERDGIYITAEKGDGTIAFAYISPDGGVDKYSLFMSRLPNKAYTVSDISKLDRLRDLITDADNAVLTD